MTTIFPSGEITLTGKNRRCYKGTVVESNIYAKPYFPAKILGGHYSFVFTGSAPCEPAREGYFARFVVFGE